MKSLSLIATLLLVTILTVCIGQGCSPLTRFSNSLASNATQEASGGNGTSYDGKPLVLHHYVDDFKCENKIRPESILIRSEKSQWVLIQNTAEKCGFINRDPVQNVKYDSVTNQATFDGKTYVRPNDFYVDAVENPNIPAVATDTGVCEDANGRCSLRAAIEQSGYTSITAPLIIHIPEATFNLIDVILLLTPTADNQMITLQGAGVGKTIIDGGSTSSLIRIQSSGAATVAVTGITFQNSQHGIDSTPGPGTLDISLCEFKYSNDVGLFSSRNTIVQKSVFTNNRVGISIDSAGLFFLKDSTIDSNSIHGISINRSSKVDLLRSTFSNNGDTGIFTSQNLNTTIDNVTVTGNYGGIYSTGMNPATAGETVLIKNSTISKNTHAGFGFRNIAMAGFSSLASFAVVNTILESNSLLYNCGIVSGPKIVFDNNLTDDSTCPFGNSNITAPVLLGPLADNGGFTQTMLPTTSSPAIDNGDNNFCSLTDQIGNARPVRKSGMTATCDIGAVEVQ